MGDKKNHLLGFLAIMAFVIVSIVYTRYFAPQPGPSGSDAAEQIVREQQERQKYWRPVNPDFGGAPAGVPQR